MNTVFEQNKNPSKKFAKRANTSLPFSVVKAIKTLGSNIQVARKRRGYSEAKLAELAHISKQTLRRAEAGEPGIGIGVLASILYILQLDRDLDLIANPEKDMQGIFLANSKLPQRIREKKDEKFDF